MPYPKSRLERIAKGLCIDCGSAAEGKRRCTVCYQRQRAHIKARADEMRVYHREYKRKQRAANPDKFREYERLYSRKPQSRKAHTAWIKAHPERVREYQRRYDNNNREKLREARRRYYRKNPERQARARRRWYVRVLADPARKTAYQQKVKQWRDANSAKCKAYTKRWVKAHPEKRRNREKEYTRTRPDFRRKRNQRSKQWCLAHPDRFRQRTERWRKANPEKVRECARRSRIKNQEKIRAGIQRWEKANPEKVRAKSRRGANARRARKQNASGSHTEAQWLARIAFYGWRCAYCECKLTPKTVTQDHVKPLSRKGSNWPSNLVPACVSCNSSKHVRKRLPKRIAQSWGSPDASK